MKKILHVLVGADAGGIAAVVYEYMSLLINDGFSYDFAICTKPGMFANKMILHGSKCFVLPLKSKGLRKYICELRKILKQNHYDIIHVHDSYMSYITLHVAKKEKIKIRIAHSHISANNENFITFIKRNTGILLNYLFSTNMIGCGKKSGEYTFGKYITMHSKKYTILRNAINVDKFKYNDTIRNEIRKQYGLNNKFVIGFVGRLSYQKNPLFALKSFIKSYNNNNNLCMIIIGDGEKKEEINYLIKENNLQDCIMMLGIRNDVEKFYQAFDLLIMPSLYEGFPVVSVEALASGLNVFLSNTITDELKIFENVRYFPIDDINIWSDRIIEYANQPLNNRYDSYMELRKNGYDINKTKIVLENIYNQKEKGNKNEY